MPSAAGTDQPWPAGGQSLVTERQRRGALCALHRGFRVFVTALWADHGRRAWLRERIYYVAFAGEFKHAKVFCAPIVPSATMRAMPPSAKLSGRHCASIRETVPWPDLRPEVISEFKSFAAAPRSLEVFLRLANSAWYAQRVPVRISAPYCCLHEEDHRCRWQHSQAKAQGCYESSGRLCAKARSGWGLRSRWRGSGEWRKPHALVVRRIDAWSASACGSARADGPRNSEDLAVTLSDLEGGLEVLQDDRTRRVFLESWAYVSDGARGFYGRSGGIELPEELAHEVLERGFDLSEAIDRLCRCGRHSRWAGRLGRALA